MALKVEVLYQLSRVPLTLDSLEKLSHFLRTLAFASLSFVPMSLVFSARLRWTTLANAPLLYFDAMWFDPSKMRRFPVVGYIVDDSVIRGLLS